jgi:type II secretory pathway component PulK
MIRRRPRREHEDRGAALLLAVGFVVMIGAIAGGLAGLATSGVNNRATLELVRNREYAADGAIENAISQVRLLTCASPSGFITDASMNSISIRVDWVNACGVVQSSDGSVVSQRNVIFSACLNTGSPCSDTAVPPVPVIIRGQVNFQQALVGAVTKTYVQSWSVNR